MNIRILHSLVILLGLYAGTTLGMIRRTGQRTTDTLSRATGRITSPLRSSTGTIAPSGRFSTQPISAYESAGSVNRRSFQQKGFQDPMRSRSMSTTSTSTNDAPLTKQEFAQFLGIPITASPEQAEEAAKALRIKYYGKPDRLMGSPASTMRLIYEAELLFSKQNGSSTNRDYFETKDRSADKKEFKKPWITNSEPWIILGVPKNASYVDAQKAHREIIQKVHPDKNQNNLAVATQAAQEANDALRWFKRDSSQSEQSYTDWAKSNVYYYWNKLKNATGQAK